MQFISSTIGLVENSTFYNDNQQDIIFSNSADNVHVNNNWFISTSAVSAKYGVVLFDGEDGWTFDNNTFVLQSGFRLLGDNYNITNNNFINMTSDLFASVYVSESDNNKLTGNTCENGDCYFRYEDTTNVFIANNSVYNSTTNINVFEIYDTIGLQLLDNNITLANAGFYVTNTTSTNISGNILDAIYLTVDAQLVGIRMEYNNTEFNITNNTICSGSANILIRQSHNGTVTNNNFNFYDQTTYLTFNANQGYEVPCSVNIAELYKGFYGDGTDTDDAEGYTKSVSYRSSNINITDNIFDSNTQCYIRNQNNTNLDINVGANWTYAWQLNSSLQDPEIYYFNENFNSISRVWSNGATSEIRDWFYMSFPSQSTPSERQFNYSVSQNVLRFSGMKETNDLKILAVPEQHAYFDGSVETNQTIADGFTVEVNNSDNLFLFGGGVRFTRFSTAFTDIDFDLNTTSNNLDMTFTGSGNFSLIGLTNLYSSYGYIAIVDPNASTLYTTSNVYSNVAVDDAWRVFGDESYSGEQASGGGTSSGGGGYTPTTTTTTTSTTLEPEEIGIIEKFLNFLENFRSSDKETLSTLENEEFKDTSIKAQSLFIIKILAIVFVVLIILFIVYVVVK